MLSALRSRHLESIGWLHDSYRDQIDWNCVLKSFRHEIVAYGFIVKFLKTKTDLAPKAINLKLFSLAAGNDLEGLKAVQPKYRSE
jgi:hypothetical protein